MAYQIFADDFLIHDGHGESLRIFEPTLEKSLNTAGKLTFSIPPDHPRYEYLQKRKTTIKVIEAGNPEPLFYGRILNDDVDIWKQKSVECEGDLAFLLDTRQRPWEYAGAVRGCLEQLIDEHNRQHPNQERKFAVGLVDVEAPEGSVTRSSDETASTFDCVKSCLWDSSLGGYVRTRGTGSVRYIDYTQSPGVHNDQIIKFGENMLDYHRYVQGENVFTAIIPYGAELDSEDSDSSERMTVASVNNGSDEIVDEEALALFDYNCAVETWDDIAEPQSLLQKGWDWLAQNKLLSITLELSAVDLHLFDINISRLNLGDTVRVISEPHSLDDHMVLNSITLNFNEPDKNQYSFGAKRDSLHEVTTSQIAQSADKVLSEVGSNYVTNDKVSGLKYDIASLYSVIEQTSDKIKLEVSEDYATKSELSQTDDRLKSTIEQTADAIYFRFDEEHSYTQGVDESFQAAQRELQTYVRFGTFGIELGQQESPFLARLGNNELGFYQNGNKVAYINNNRLYITNGEILTQLIIGKFAFLPRANGNLSFKKIG